MKKHTIPMTYGPKKDAVFSGDCTQTMRGGRKFNVGDRILLYDRVCKACEKPPAWDDEDIMERCMTEGCPNEGKGMNRFNTLWNRRLRGEITKVTNIKATAESVTFCSIHVTEPRRKTIVPTPQWVEPWNSTDVGFIAALDHIDPPTGLELKRVLEHLNGKKFTDEPEEYQIIRWKVTEGTR